MVKYKVAYALPVVAALVSCASFFNLTGDAFAYTEDVDGYAVPVGDTDEERYNDLKLAIADNKNVRLNDDISHYVAISGVPSIAIDHTMTLDLNGHILSTASTSGGSAGNTAIAVSGENTIFTIDDNSDEKNGAIRYDHKGNAAPTTLWIGAGAKVVLKNGSVYSPYGRTTTGGEGMAVNMKGTGSAFEMSGGAIRSHEESTSSSNYGVRFNSSGTFSMTGGEIATVGSALAVPNSNEAVVDISGNAILISSKGKGIDITSAKTSGQISGISVENMTIAGAVGLKNVYVAGNLEVKSGERTLSGVAVGGGLNISGGTTNITSLVVNDMTTITAGQVTLGDGAVMAGGLTYQSAASSALTINDGAMVNNLVQSGKSTTVSYTDKDTKQKVQATYDTYGVLNINGGTFIGAFTVATPAQIEASNSARKDYVDSYNEHSGKTPITYSDVASVPVIAGGMFTAEPNEEDIVDGYEAEQNEETGIWTILPKEINMVENGAMESDGGGIGALYGSAVFNRGFMADRKAYFALSTLDNDEIEILVLDATAGGDLVLPFDASLWSPRDGTHRIDGVQDTSITIRVILTEEQYNTLKSYDAVKVVCFGEDGKEIERLDAVLGVDGEDYYVEFTTTHLSTYGVVGVNDEASGSTTPETGTMTREGASAMSAAIITSVAVGLLVSIASFAYLIRRR